MSTPRAWLVMLGALTTAFLPPAPAAAEDSWAAIDRLFEDYRLDAHVPGLVYGVVQDGRLVHVGTFGVQDLSSRRPVTRETLFRIASMTKAFTALTVLSLRDAGKVQLDAPAEQYVPELRTWKYPTQDSPRIGVRDLLSHAAGFVTDDPWGDRQTPLPEADFTRLLQEGVPFARSPGITYEYSNLGYALLGRIIRNVSGRPFEETIGHTLLQPLGMASSGFVADAAPPARRALGYRWEDGQWREEPTLGPGAFGAMGGLSTDAEDYARWVVFLLSAWPPRDAADNGPVRRASVRELAQGLDFPRFRARYGRPGAPPCRQAVTYGKGFHVALDCDLGLTLSHGGGYPGFGSHVLLLPDRGVGIYAFANRTYSAPSAPVWDTAMALLQAGRLPHEHAVPVSPELSDAYRVAGGIYDSGVVTASQGALAMNFLLDRSAEGWARDLARLRTQAGACDTRSPLTAGSALSGEFLWRCERGRLHGSLLLSPTRPSAIQKLQLEAVEP